MITLVKAEKQIITVKELINQLSTFTEFTLDNRYLITECFKKNGTREYTLHNLKGEVVDDAMVCFYDEDNKIYDDDLRVLLAFPIDKVIVVTNWDKHWKATLVFDDGFINIKRI